MACWKLIVSKCWRDTKFNVIIMGIAYVVNGYCSNYIYMHLLCLFALVCSSSWIQLSGMHYMHGSMMVINLDLLPTFGVILWWTDFIRIILFWKFYTHFVFPLIITHMKFP